MKSLAKIGLLLVLIAFLSVAFVGPRYFVESKQEVPTNEFAKAMQPADQEALSPIETPSPEPLKETESVPTEPEREKSKAADSAAPSETVGAPEETTEVNQRVATAAEILPILEKVQAEDLNAARDLAENLSSSLTPEENQILESFLVRMNTGFSEKTALQQELNSTANSLALSKAKLSEANRELAEIERSEFEQMANSVEELKQATLSAKKATEQASRLTTRLKDIRPITPVLVDPEDTGETKEVPTGPVSLPSPTSISFGFDSTYINSASEETLLELLTELTADPRILIQLRGNSDTTGPSDYNAILANSRCEAVKKYLIEKGIEGSRISIVAVKEGETGQSESSSKKLRRVDIFFSE